MFNKNNYKIFKNKFSISCIIFILTFCILNGLIIYNINKVERNLDSYFRLHIVANSDNIDDQVIKLKVAQKVNDYIASLRINNLSDKSDVKATVSNNIQDILQICQNELAINYIDTSVSAKIGNIYYDKKVSNNLSMDCGIYDSLQLVIGEGNGQNWWSLIYPNAYDGLAIYTEQANIKKDDTYHISNSDLVSSKKTIIKFGIFELFNKLFN